MHFALEERRACSASAEVVLSKAEELFAEQQFESVERGLSQLHAKSARGSARSLSGLAFSEIVEVEVSAGSIHVRGDNRRWRRVLQLVLLAPLGVALLCFAWIQFFMLPADQAPSWYWLLPLGVGAALWIALVRSPLVERLLSGTSAAALEAFADQLAMSSERAAEA